LRRSRLTLRVCAPQHLLALIEHPNTLDGLVGLPVEKGRARLLRVEAR